MDIATNREALFHCIARDIRPLGKLVLSAELLCGRGASRLELSRLSSELVQPRTYLRSADIRSGSNFFNSQSTASYELAHPSLRGQLSFISAAQHVPTSTTDKSAARALPRSAPPSF